MIVVYNQSRLAIEEPSLLGFPANAALAAMQRVEFLILAIGHAVLAGDVRLEAFRFVLKVVIFASIAAGLTRFALSERLVRPPDLAPWATVRIGRARGDRSFAARAALFPMATIKGEIPG